MVDQENGGNGTVESGTSSPSKTAKFDPDTIPPIVFMVFILVINACVILLIGCYSSLRKPSNIILGSLAVSDFLTGFIGIPLLVTCSATYLDDVCTSSITFFTFMALSTVLHLTVMTCDRYIYIMWALRYRDIVNRGRVLIALGIIWFISLGQSLVRLAWTWDVAVLSAGEELALVQEKETIYFLFNTIVFFVLPLILMTGFDAHMLLLLRRQCQRIARENVPAEFIKHEHKLQKRQRRAVMTCVLLLVLYVIHWLPYFILHLLHQFHYQQLQQLPHEVNVTIYYLRLCTSILNPLAYTLRKQDLKRRLKATIYNICPRLRLHGAENRTEQFPLSSRTDL